MLRGGEAERRNCAYCSIRNPCWADGGYRTVEGLVPVKRSPAGVAGKVQSPTCRRATYFAFDETAEGPDASPAGRVSIIPSRRSMAPTLNARRYLGDPGDCAPGSRRH